MEFVIAVIVDDVTEEVLGATRAMLSRALGLLLCEIQHESPTEEASIPLESHL